MHRMSYVPATWMPGDGDYGRYRCHKYRRLHRMRCMRPDLPRKVYQGNKLMKNENILIVGVGGQGVILASDTIAEIGMNNGYDVKKSDSIGMAQRGGSVVSPVRWGERVFSLIFTLGD